MGAAPLLDDEADDAEHTGRRGSDQQSPDVQVQAQVRSLPQVQVQVPVPAVSYPQGPRITIRPRADPMESGRGSRASGEVRVDRGPAYIADAAPLPPPLPSRFATGQDGAYNTIVELPPGSGMALEPRFRALSPAGRAEQQMPQGGDPPREQTPEGDEVQEEEEEDEDEEAQEGTDDSDGGDAQVEGSFPPPPSRPAVQLFTQVVRLQPAEPYGNLHEYSAGYPPGQQQAGSEEGQQLEEADGGEGASGSYDDGILDGEGSGGESGQQEQHPPPPPPPMSRYPQQPYNYQYQQQRPHEEDAV